MKNRLLLILVALLVALPLAARAQNNQQLTPQQQELADYIKSNYTKREVMIPMRDGVKLFTSVYEPVATGEKYPFMLNRTPYTVAPYGEDKNGQVQYKTALGPDELFAREGYIFVYQDVRGRWGSEGEFVNVRPDIENRTAKDIDESTDTYDTVEWLLKNVPNNNGRVGIYGISYPGFYTSAGIIDSHPAIKAASPQAPVSDWFHGDDMHHNGALFLAQNYAFFGFFGQPRPRPVTSPASLNELKAGTEDGYKFFKEMGGLKNAGDIYERQLKTRIEFWDEMMAHPTYDQFWKDRNILPKLKNIKAAVMTVGGWYDNEDLYGALRTYQYIERQNPGIFNILVIGPWDHGAWARRDMDWLGTAYFGQKTGAHYREKMELPFFNHFLKDKGNLGVLKEINLFETGENQWRHEDSWQMTGQETWTANGAQETPLYLLPGGRLSFEQPRSSANSFDEYVSDPMNPVPYTQKITFNYPRDFMTEDQRFASRRPDVLTYQTDVLTGDVTVAGDLKPNLFVSSSGTDSDFVVKLIDVFPDDYTYPNGVKPPETSAYTVFAPGGYQMLLRGEPMPARFRNGFEKAEPLTPNQPARISFVMPGIAHTFKKGHRIMVQVQSTWFPLVARNPQKFVQNYKLGTNTDYQSATERVYTGGERASSIILPVVKR